MCSELFRIPVQWGAVPIFGFGILLAVWLVVALVILVQTYRASGWSTDTIISGVVMLVVAQAIVFLPALFPSGLPIRGYGVMLLCAGAAGVGLSVIRGRQMGIQPEVIVSLAFWLFAGGIIGARLFYVIEYWHTNIQAHDLLTTVKNILRFTEGGLVIYGGYIGAMVAFAAFVYKHRLPFLALADIAAPGFMIGLALGRVGCLLNGCCYGGETEQPWAVTFPKDSPPYLQQLALGETYGFRIGSGTDGHLIVEKVWPNTPASQAGLAPGDVIQSINLENVTELDRATGMIYNVASAEGNLTLTTGDGQIVAMRASLPARSRPVHPTQIYSTINAALIAWLLWAYYPYRRRDGEVVALMLTVYPISRFLLEIIRTDEAAIFGTGLSISQNISVLILGGVVVGWLILRSLPPYRALPKTA